MTDIPADFDTEEIEDIRRMAEKLGMTEEELTEHAVKKYIEHVKDEARQRIYTKPKLRVYK